MESEKVGRDNLRSSVKVESVQALISKGLKKNIPPRYIRDDLEFAENFIDDSLHIPVIDMNKLDDIDESTKLHQACKDWGFFQLINHGISEVVENMKIVSEDFFKLSQEEKMSYEKMPNDLDGYGRGNIFSEEQKLEWGDTLSMVTRPLPTRNMAFWPISPTSFRSVLDAYSSEMEKVKMKLLRVIANNLGVDQIELLDSFDNGLQVIAVHYYPPCELANKVIGLTPHSDATGLTLLVQVNDVQGLQIKKNDKWILVKPLSGAIIVNIGDIIEIMSNGEYKSIEHRVTVNYDKERMSIAAFHSPNMKAMVGPLSHLLKKNNQVAKYKNIVNEDYVKLFIINKLDGKSLLDQMKSI